MRFSDTSPDVEARQLEIQHAMTGEQRLLLALDMCQFARELAKAGIRDKHPDWSEKKVVRELLRLTMLPEELPDCLKIVD